MLIQYAYSSVLYAIDAIGNIENNVSFECTLFTSLVSNLLYDTHRLPLLLLATKN